MDIKQIQNFILINKCKSFSKASKELYISQPALTKQMQSIEKELGCNLFVRENQGLSLTKEGEIFLEYANKVIELTEGMEKDIQSQLWNIYNHLVIGHSTQYHFQLIEKVVSELYAINSDLDISVKQLMPQNQLELIKNGELSCGLMHLVSVIGEEEVEYTTLLKGGAVVHISENDPLSNEKEVSVKQLKDYVLIVNKHADPKYRDYILGPYKKLGIKPIIKEVDGKNNVFLASGIGKYIGITSAYTTNQYKTKALPLKELKEGCDIVLVYKKGSKNPYIQKIISIIQKSL